MNKIVGPFTSLILKYIWKCIICWLLPYLYSTSLMATDGIKVSDKYPFYWEYKNQPVLLLGGTNDDNLFQWSYEDKKRHLDSLKAIGGNYIRNTMSDRLNEDTYPIVHQAFKKLDNGQYDLTQWNEIYWNGFTDLLELCLDRDIVVQLEIWDRFDVGKYNWMDSPWRPSNNINYTDVESGLPNEVPRDQNKIFPGVVPGHPLYEAANSETRKKYDLTRSFQERFVNKILYISLKYPNVLYAMNNETHVHQAWGQYWISFIKKGAEKENVTVTCTDMMDNIWRGERDKRVLPIYLKNRDKYDYVDISQVNSRHLGETHWHIVMYVIGKLKEQNYLTHMTKLYGHDGNKNSFVPGDTDNAIEEWWQNLIAGIAGQRFHRLTLGLGLSKTSITCIKATRLVEEKIKFWEVEPSMDLLSVRAENEAYLAANPGEKYVLYFTNDNGGGASVALDLTDFGGETFTVHWISIETGKPGPIQILRGGEKVTVDRPAPGHWVAAIVRKI